ncbi:MAG: hypothetical protein AVDCRST_MAG62-733, partial [uncultured Sphingomonas sp.]
GARRRCASGGPGRADLHLGRGGAPRPDAL